MKLFNTAYDTTVLGGYVLDRLEASLKVALIQGQYHRTGDSNIIEIQGAGSSAAAVPEFAHPIAIEFNGQKLLAIDARPFGSMDRLQGRFVVRNAIEYGLLVRRAQLTDIWINEDAALLRDVSPVPLSVFASWVSESVARRYALDPKEQLNLAILSAFHYLSLFSETGHLDESGRLKMVSQVTRALRCSAEDALTVLGEGDQSLARVGDFCAAAAAATGSIRLQEFNPGVLISIIKSTWFGVNAQEMLAVALEHPPTWIALLMAAHVERTYKNSGLAKLVERQAHKEPNKLFLRSALNLTQLSPA